LEHRDHCRNYSGCEQQNGGNCIEVGTTASAVLVRDTKDHGDGPVLAFAPQAWEAFAAKVKQS
jgi:uncharacterized protein DUF397